MPVIPCQIRSSNHIPSEKKRKLYSELQHVITANDNIIGRRYNMGKIQSRCRNILRNVYGSSKLSSSDPITQRDPMGISLEMKDGMHDNASRFGKECVRNGHGKKGKEAIKSQFVYKSSKFGDTVECSEYFGNIMGNRNMVLFACQQTVKKHLNVKFSNTTKIIPIYNSSAIFRSLESKYTIVSTNDLELFSENCLERSSDMPQMLSYANIQTFINGDYDSFVHRKSLFPRTSFEISENKTEKSVTYPIVPNIVFMDDMPTGGDLTVTEDTFFLLDILYTERLISKSSLCMQRTYSGSVSTPFYGRYSKHIAYCGNFGFCDGINIIAFETSQARRNETLKADFLQNPQDMTREAFLALSHMFNLRKLVGMPLLPTIDFVNRPTQSEESFSLMFSHNFVLIRESDRSFEQTRESAASIDCKLVKNFIRK